jgi:hypothetical protein
MRRTNRSALEVVATTLVVAATLAFAASQVKAEVSLSYVRAGAAVCATQQDLEVYEATHSQETDGSCTRLAYGDYYHVTQDWSPTYNGNHDVTVILFDSNVFFTKTINIE